MMEEKSSKNIRDDLILFKNDTLKDIKETEKAILEKYRNIEFKLNEKLELFENEFKKFDSKVIEMSAFLETLKDTNDNITQLLQYKTKSENSIFDLELKLRSLDKESHDSLYNISNILKDSVIYPGTIGSVAKFKTFHDFIDYVLTQISNLRQFKDKITKEVNENKIRADTGIDKLKASHDMLLDKTKALVVNEVISLEEKNNSCFKLYDEKFQKMRVDNEKFGISIKTNEDLVSNFKKDIQDMNLKKNELIIRVSELADKNKQNNREINSLKDKFMSLTNYLKQLKFKREKEDQEDLNKKIIDIEKTLNLHELSNSNKELIKIKLKKNSSGLKEYIKGKININQFQSLSNKNNLKPTESVKNYNYNSNNNNNDNNINYNSNNNNNYINSNNFNNNFKTIEPKEEENEKENKTMHPTLSRDSKAFKTIPIFKEDEKNVVQKKEKIKNLISVDYFNNNNSDIKLMRNRQTIDTYSKINAFSLNDKPSYRNLYSEQSHLLSKGKDYKEIKEIKDIKELKNISLNVDGNEILNINTNEPKNIKYKNIIQNVKNIVQNKPKGSNYLSGFPRIVTNQGERIIISSHPVYHRHKFTNNINPNLFALNKTLHKFYGNSKENKMNGNKANANKVFSVDKNILKENWNNIKRVNDNESYIQNNDLIMTTNNNRLEIEKGKDLSSFKGRNNSYQNLNGNRYLDLMMNNDNMYKIKSNE